VEKENKKLSEKESKLGLRRVEKEKQTQGEI